MRHLKRFDALILERTSLLSIGFPKDFMQFLQQTLKLKLFNPDDFRVPLSELKKEKSFKKIIRDLLKGGYLVLILDAPNDKYYAIYSDKEPENTKELDISKAVSEFKSLTLKTPILKMDIRNTNCPLFWGDSSSIPKVIQFQGENSVNDFFKKYIINDKRFGISSFNVENISKLIEDIGVMRLSTMLAHYIIKQRIKNFDNYIKKYSPWFIESDKFNF